jgi:hypothetical protein
MTEKSMSGDQAESTGASAEMPRYRCHKEVWALKIEDVRQAPADRDRVHAGGDWYIVPADARYAPIMVGHNFITKHAPKIGGYFVVYKDGYQSFSPAEAFEDGYTLIRS